ncbi:endo-1,4-beta-xylanase [Paraurantiacibacter namhicola]|uniref:Beta-xylanase n=1 Tax=Paraurantiacibacter namhicola TaxID=645517 RepID=A0A1C7D6Y1_9SPHN|nr:endo-1,4-beta-xylanase [Paraurantiacibacter namhicola]ANU07229.1 Exoglucanase/xylanase precursor [Paraurantiacibacter namhicola]
MISRRDVMKYGSLGAAALSLPSGLARAAGGDAVTLDSLARAKGMRFGTATDQSELVQPDLAALIARECSVVVGENAQKWKKLEPREGVFRDENAQAIAAFAAIHDMELRGHCFVWNQDDRIPGWLLEREDELAKNGGEGLIRQMWEHARQLADAFPTVASWDAVNEVITPWEGEVRDALLSRILGDRLMDVGFAMMREVAPEAQLVYNDYMSWQKRPNHRNGVLKLLEGALSRGVPIDALGIQSHLINTLAQPIDERGWRDFMQSVQDMGLKVLITELDTGDRYLEETDPAKRDAEIAAFTKGYLDLTLSFENVERIVLWSISDRDTYLNRPQYPEGKRRPDGLPFRAHPFDAELRKRPMYDAIAAALRSAPKRA